MIAAILSGLSMVLLAVLVAYACHEPTIDVYGAPEDCGDSYPEEP